MTKRAHAPQPSRPEPEIVRCTPLWSHDALQRSLACFALREDGDPRVAMVADSAYRLLSEGERLRNRMSLRSAEAREERAKRLLRGIEDPHKPPSFLVPVATGVWRQLEPPSSSSVAAWL